MKDKRPTHSIKELMNTEETQEQNSPERIPNFIIKAPKFSCALSPFTMWYRDLQYVSCPLASGQRDMPGCNKCKLKWEGREKPQKEYKENTNGPIVEIKKTKTAIPKIGKTYSTE